VRDATSALPHSVEVAAERQQEDGWGCGLPGGKQRPELGVGGDDDAVLSIGPVEDLAVARWLQRVLADVYGVVTGNSRCLGHGGR
jgi:hypothetical protein